MNSFAAPTGVDLLTIRLEGAGLSVSLHGALIVLVVLAVLASIAFRFFGYRRGAQFEIDEAELGIGDHKIKLRPNYLDRTVAYKIWVELSTRKIGLPIDLDHDVVVEIYDSWYAFFQITRELIKDVPVSRFRQESTQKIINLSIDLLNNGLRPHLTKWQARFRRWYDKQLDRKENLELNPQEIQAKFLKFDELRADIEELNARLIIYRARMKALVVD